MESQALEMITHLEQVVRFALDQLVAYVETEDGGTEARREAHDRLETVLSECDEFLNAESATIHVVDRLIETIEATAKDFTEKPRSRLDRGDPSDALRTLEEFCEKLRTHSRSLEEAPMEMTFADAWLETTTAQVERALEEIANCKTADALSPTTVNYASGAIDAIMGQWVIVTSSDVLPVKFVERFEASLLNQLQSAKEMAGACGEGYVQDTMNRHVRKLQRWHGNVADRLEELQRRSTH